MAQVFVPFPAAPALARIPLLPLTCPPDDRGAGEPVDPLVREGMFLASRQASALAAAAPSEGRGGETVRSYTQRARTRPTPQGVFAGVAAAFFSGSGAPDLTMGGMHRACSVPDPSWLAALSDRVLADPDVLPRLTLFANNLTIQRGGRLEHERPAEPGGTGVRRATVRATDVTLLIVQVCAGGALWGEVLDAVTRAWPGAPEASVRAMVSQLVGHGFLLADLLGEGGSDDPLGHLLAKLPSGSALREDLALLRRHLADADTHPPGAPQRLTMLAAARDVADRVGYQERPVRVDVAVDAHLIMPARLAREAADAAGVLWRIGSDPDPLVGFHDRFIHRYGHNQFVPLFEAIDPVIGVGADMAESPSDTPQGSTRVLISLIASAEHGVEVELDAATVEALATVNGSAAARPPRTAEIYVRVFADTPQDAAAGRLRLAVAVGGGTQEAGSSSGRFASLLPALKVEDADGDAVVAELVVRARTPAGATLAPLTGFAAHRIPLGVPVRPGDLKLDDLLLVSDGRRLLLWSAGLGRRIIPVLFSRLSPHLLPPIAQFLRLLGQHGCRPWGAWSWGPLAALPFQPRVRYRSTILIPARWTLPSTVIGAAEADWEAALDCWRASTVPAPPDVVVVTDHDRALPLDLRRADDRALLRRYVKRGATAVTEQPGGPGAVQGVVAGPDGAHALELVVSLAREQTPLPPPPLPAVAVRRPGEGLYLPGGRWLSLVIRTPAICQDEVLARLAAVCDGIDGRWFWLRYADYAGPHLRVRFHGDPEYLGGRVLPTIGDLVGRLIRDRLASGLAVEPYEQEIERYGGSPEAIDAAEEVFAADSRLVLATVTAMPDPDQRTVVAALSAATIARVLADGDRRALAGHHVDRDARRKMAELRPLTRTAAALPSTGPAWAARDKALVTYRDVLDPEQCVSCASSVVHMHVNRILGAAVPEPLVRALAVDLLFLGTT
ncbi:lantibiotic dehydratase [Nonomuraea sp. NPDC052129]|uniref:lantibiotic dehydratase n=1 Tax=Nonomuraea sp. NPDC052129 TaxID=3154651 RepID=UPI003414CBB6